VSLAAWLRFAELSLLAAWLGWQLYGRTTRSGTRSSLVPGLAALIAAAQFILQAQATTDPYTSLTEVLPHLLRSFYGFTTAAAFGLSTALAIWFQLGKPFATPSSKGLAALTSGAVMGVLILCGAASADAVTAATVVASSGELVMSPTLAVPRSATTTPNPYASDPASAQRGQAIYQQNCAACHGLNGDGNGPAIAGLRIKPPTFRNPQHFLAPGMDGAHFWVIQHGDGKTAGMPAWQDRLTEQQMWDALDYVKQIAAGRAGSGA